MRISRQVSQIHEKQTCRQTCAFLYNLQQPSPKNEKEKEKKGGGKGKIGGGGRRQISTWLKNKRLDYYYRCCLFSLHFLGVFFCFVVFVSISHLAGPCFIFFLNKSIAFVWISWIQSAGCVCAGLPRMFDREDSWKNNSKNNEQIISSMLFNGWCWINQRRTLMKLFLSSTFIPILRSWRFWGRFPLRGRA